MRRCLRRRATDQGSLETAAEERTEDRSAAPADQRTFAGPDAALMLLLIVVIVIVVVAVVVTGIVILAAARAVADSVVELAVVAVVAVIAIVSSTLGVQRKHRGEQERDDEYSVAYLHHSKSDANFDAYGKRSFGIPNSRGAFKAVSEFVQGVACLFSRMEQSRRRKRHLNGLEAR